MITTRGVLSVALLVGVAALGYLAGERLLAASTPSGRDQPRTGLARPRARTAGVSRATSSSLNPTAQRAPRGAVATAATYLELLDRTSIMPGTGARLDAITLSPLTAQALAAAAAGGELLVRLARWGPAFVRGWRLGYSVESYSPALARVAIWAMGIVQSAREVLAPQYSTTMCTLRWVDGGWRVAAARTVAGPTPRLDGSDPAAVAAFARSADRFHAFGDSP